MADMNIVKELSVDDIDALLNKKKKLELRLEEEGIGEDTKKEIMGMIELLEAKCKMIESGKQYVIAEKKEG